MDLACFMLRGTARCPPNCGASPIQSALFARKLWNEVVPVLWGPICTTKCPAPTGIPAAAVFQLNKMICMVMYLAHHPGGRRADICKRAAWLTISWWVLGALGRPGSCTRAGRDRSQLTWVDVVVGPVGAPRHKALAKRETNKCTQQRIIYRRIDACCSSYGIGGMCSMERRTCYRTYGLNAEGLLTGRHTVLF